MKIERKQAVKEALELLEEVGLDKLSTRKLAQRLGVQQPALYWYFRDKQALLNAMNSELLHTGKHPRPPKPGENYLDFLREYAINFRACLLSIRDGARIHIGSDVESIEIPIAESQLGTLTAAGLTVTEALTILVSISRYVVGFVLKEQTEIRFSLGLEDVTTESFPLLFQASKALDDKNVNKLFMNGIDLLLSGIKFQLTTNEPENVAT